ncbi:anaphase-promoting complex subunit 13-like [Babylonia areolata]|uniref:anaphase-promoting complex subunit 13-like n=1 Tax=Babylonia areolata TaxID=304850 RepID=UPI003FD3131F
MDSEIQRWQRQGQLMDLIDEKWREDILPNEDIAVPQMELPELEQDNGPSTETLQEQEQKWSDLALQSLHEQPPTSTQS